MKTMPITNIDALLAKADALIFDCDGTLIESASLYARAWASGFALSGKNMSLDWYKARAGLSEYVLMDAFEAQHGVKLDREATVTKMRETFLNELALLREIAVVAEIARRNHGERPMAVASGGPAAIVEPSLTAAGLRGLFDTVVTFDDVGRAKPEPDLLLEAARRLGVPPERCLVFEDSPQGIEAARQAGMHVVDVARLDVVP
jgi:beta-phosphoglucomutase-like phosphatase (HAD superfamily)